MAFDWSFLDNAPRVQSEESEWEFRPADRFEAGLQETFGSLWGVASAVSDTLGFDKARDWTANRAKDLFEKAADKELVNVQFTEISDPIEAGQWVAQTAVDFLPSMIGGGGSGIATRFGLKALSGTPVVSKTVEHFAHKAFTKNLKELTEEAGEGFTKDQLYKAAIKKTAGDTGAMLGVAGFEGGQMTGQSYLYDYEKRGGDEASPAAAFATGAVGAALTLLSPVDRMLAGKLPTGKSIFATSFKEASQEVGQELTTIAHEAGIDPDMTIGDLLSTEEGANRLLESGAAGALLGGIFGGTSKAYEKIYGQKEQAAKEDTPVTSWQDNLQAVREEQKKVLTERPEEILAKAGIDTSGDAKAPDITLQTPAVDTTNIAPVDISAPTEVPTSAVKSVPNIPEVAEPVINNQEENILQRDVPISETTGDAQYNTDREVKRKIVAQKEIDKNFPPEPEKSEVSKLSTQILQKQQEVNELQQVVKNTTNLKEKNAATQKLNGAKSVLQDMKQKLVAERKVAEVAPALEEKKREIQNKPAFKEWFKDSKVVDEKGEPLVVYHGTDKDFSVFKVPNKKRGNAFDRDSNVGVFFSGQPEQANYFALEKASRNKKAAFGEPTGGRVIPTYLTISNPLVVDYSGAEPKFKSPDEVIALSKKAKENGHDGLILKGLYDAPTGKPSDLYIPFKNTQIKSIFNNKWDGKNPDISASLTTNLREKNEKRIEEAKAPTETNANDGQKANEVYEEKEGLQVTPEQTVAYKREFLKRADSADKLIRVSEFADKHLGGAKAHSNIKNLTDHILSVAKKKLPGIKVVDVSESKGNIKASPTRSLKAYYSKGKIYLDKEYFSTRKDSKGLEETIIHEVAHGLTVEEMEANPAIKKQVTNLLDTVRQDVLTLEELSLLESKYKFDPVRINQNREQFDKEFTRFPTEVYYGLLNEKEFLAQTFSSYEFQKALSSVKLEKPKGSIRTVWDKFVNLVREVLGLSQDNYTALDESLRLSTELMGQEGAVRTDSSISPSLDKKERPLDIAIREEAKKSKEEKIKSMRGSTPLVEYFSKSVGNFKETLREIGQSSSDILRGINTRLLKIMRIYEMMIAESNVSARKQIKDFMDKYKSMSTDDKNLLWYVTGNTDEWSLNERENLFKKYNLKDSYSSVENLLSEIRSKKESFGLNQYGEIENWFPRKVTDYDGLMREIANDPTYNSIQAAIDSLGKDATKQDKEHLLNTIINTGRIPGIAFKKGTSDKQRTLTKVLSNWRKYYASPADALLAHIYESNEQIAAHSMFTDSPARMKIVRKRNSLYEKLDEKGLSEDKKKEIEAEIQNLEDNLKNTEKSFDKLDSVLIEAAPNMSPKEARLALNVIRARLTQRGMNGSWAALRNLSLMSSLGSPTSAITQIGDFAFTVFRSGPKNTMKAMFGNRIIRAEDLDLEHSMKEFQTEGTAKWLDKTLTISGLKYMDLFAKNISINASLLRAKEMKLKDFKKEYEYILGEDTERTYKDIQEDKNSELTRFFVFNELSDWQPISLTEMPMKYLTGGNGRVFYALKSYNIKALNNIYRESVYKWKTATDSKEKRTAAIQTGKLITLMVIAGASADELKDFLLGKSANSFADNVHNNLLKIAFMSRYTLDQGFSKGFFETMMKDILLPPTGPLDDPLSDIYNTFKGDPDWKTVQNLPWGKLPYNWFADRPDESDNKKLKQRVVDGFKGGDSISKYSKEIREYNQWARRNKKEPITTSSLLKAKRKKENV